MKKVIDKLKAIQAELSKAKNEGFVQGIYWRVHSIVLNSGFEYKNIYLKRLSEMDNLDMGIRFEQNKGRLKGIIDHILDDIDQSSAGYESNETIEYPVLQKAKETKRLISNRVFVVHGHNEVMKQSVARFIEKLGLQVIILHEQPNQGLTVIEKFLSNSDVGFAIVLLSADDVGYSKKDGDLNSKNRARQNVIFELGYFTGKIGRNRVIALVENSTDFELPSDYHGVLYVDFNSNTEKWKIEIAKELKENGYQFDIHKVL